MGAFRVDASAQDGVCVRRGTPYTFTEPRSDRCRRTRGCRRRAWRPTATRHRRSQCRTSRLRGRRRAVIDNRCPAFIFRVGYARTSVPPAMRDARCAIVSGGPISRLTHVLRRRPRSAVGQV